MDLFFVMLCMLVLLPNAKCKLIHNRCRCMLKIKTTASFRGKMATSHSLLLSKIFSIARLYWGFDFVYNAKHLSLIEN